MIKLCLFILIFLGINIQMVNAEPITHTNEVVVGFYEEYPYYYLDLNGNPHGYYHNIMEFISEKLNFEYKYEILPFSECIEKLENGKIDLLLGIMKTEDRENILRYSKYRVNSLDNIVITNKEINYGDIEGLNGLTFGYIEENYNQKDFYDFLMENGIEFKTRLANSNEQLKEWLKCGEIDFIIANQYDKSYESYNSLYNYFVGPSYIAVSKNKEELMDSIDDLFDKMSPKDIKELNDIYNKYFNIEFQYATYTVIALVITGTIVILVLLIYKFKRIYTKRKSTYKYLNYLKNNQFKLYYQSIISSKTNKIIGFEGLIRLDDGGKILTPDSFLNIIEELEIMYNITLWVIEQAIIDYRELKLRQDNPSDNMHVSVNISYKELLNSNFIYDVKSILSKYKNLEYLICFEITERFPYEDIELVNERISILKEYGIKFAMDDFGIEYSNFDILEKIDYDIVKLDKIFIDQCEESVKKQQILKSIINILNIYNKEIVIEGVEMDKQVYWIKKIGGSNIYMQGYYYSKPNPTNRG